MRNAFVIYALVCALAGCATVGNRALDDKTKINSIIENKTTASQVRALIGEPNHSETAENGDKIWSYWLATSSMVSGTRQKNLVLRIRKEIVIAKDSGGN